MKQQLILNIFLGALLFSVLIENVIILLKVGKVNARKSDQEKYEPLKMRLLPNRNSGPFWVFRLTKEFKEMYPSSGVLRVEAVLLTLIAMLVAGYIGFWLFSTVGR